MVLYINVGFWSDVLSRQLARAYIVSDIRTYRIYKKELNE